MVLSGMVLGCAGAAGSVAIADMGPPKPQQFEHMCMGPSMSMDGINDDVRKAGSQGWELVTMHEGIVCFKRPH